MLSLYGLRKVNHLKRAFPRVFLMLVCVIVGFFIASVIYAVTGFSMLGRAPEKPSASVDVNNAGLTELAYDVLVYIRDGDFVALSHTIHPDFGVVFSPQATVTLSTNRRFSAVQVADFANDANAYFWGFRNGSGEPIEITPVEYFETYVYSKDYFNASLVGVNRIVRSGNALENMTEEFPGLKFVDFHIPGGERDTPEEFDWSSLRLGFEEHEGVLWLTVIINSKWTV